MAAVIPCDVMQVNINVPARLDATNGQKFGIREWYPAANTDTECVVKAVLVPLLPDEDAEKATTFHVERASDAEAACELATRVVNEDGATDVRFALSGQVFFVFWQTKVGDEPSHD